MIKITDKQMEKYTESINKAVTSVSMAMMLPMKERHKIIQDLADIEQILVELNEQEDAEWTQSKEY